jgi:dTDP-4-amino-4,6-dideoxygalactose transaminase
MIKLASPDISESDILRVADVIKSGSLIQGVNVVEFETLLSNFTGIPFSAVLSSGTAALHLSLIALGIGANDSVIVPAFTFPATANVVEIIGAEVILADVDPTSYVITPKLLEETILKNRDKNIKAVIVVHEFGYPAEMKAISEIVRKYGLYLIEDAACALGTIADNYHVGYYSDMACFSFHPRKAITTGEGGAVITTKTELADKIKILRNHGISYQNYGMDFIYAGFNYRMTDFQAALAIGQLERFKEELLKRKFLASKYYEILKEEKKVRLPENNDGHSWQSFMIVLDKSIDRKKIIEELLEKGIQTNLGAQAIHCLSYYKQKYNYSHADFSNASQLFNNGLVLPLYGKLVEEEVIHISKSLKKALDEIILS